MSHDCDRSAEAGLDELLGASSMPPMPRHSPTFLPAGDANGDGPP